MNFAGVKDFGLVLLEVIGILGIVFEELGFWTWASCSESEFPIRYEFMFGELIIVTVLGAGVL